VEIQRQPSISSRILHLSSDSMRKNTISQNVISNNGQIIQRFSVSSLSQRSSSDSDKMPSRHSSNSKT